jgi:hypothetical protein
VTPPSRRKKTDPQTIESLLVKRRSPATATRWTAKVVKRLGKVPDTVLADELGVRPTTVASERKRRGIAPFHHGPWVVWSAEMISFLGSAGDRQVAAELGIGMHSVTHKRLSLGIPAANPQKHRRFRWRPRHDALLGTAPDSEVAHRLGISAITVLRRRHSLAIAPYLEALKAFPWTKAQIRALGTKSDAALARRFGLDSETVRAKRRQLGIAAWQEVRPVVLSPELRACLELPTMIAHRRTSLNPNTIKRLRDVHHIKRQSIADWRTSLVAKRLGREPDAVLASELGVSPKTVAKYRRRSGHVRPWKRWTSEDEALLGKLSDREVAQRTGRSLTAVARRRIVKTKRRTLTATLPKPRAAPPVPAKPRSQEPAKAPPNRTKLRRSPRRPTARKR